jgi:hypothetical protein
MKQNALLGWRGRHVVVAAALAVCVAGATARAQSRREPTPAEATVLTRFINVMKPIFNRFGDASWQVSDNDFPENAGDVTISIKAGLPLDDCIGGFRTWTVAYGSPLFNTRLKPLTDRVQTLTDAMKAKLGAGKDASTEMSEIQRLGQQMKQLEEVTIEVCGNSPDIEAAALAPDKPSLLPHVIAHKVVGNDDVCGVDIPACYVLAYGDWTHARHNGSAYDYRFAHPAATPYLENVVIKLHGADDRIQELLKAVDWTSVNQALTN